MSSNSINGDAEPPPPPVDGSDDSSVSSVSTTASTSSSSSTTSSGGRSIGRTRLLLPKLFQKSAEQETSFKQQSPSPLQKDSTGRISPTPPPSWNTTDHHPVPVYKDERMLMRSPLPSPRASPKKIIPNPHTLADDSDSEDGRYQREQTAMKRLVNMAKQQQNFAAAWFAASNGEEPILPALRPRRKRPPPSLAIMKAQQKLSSSSSSSGPVDLDNGQEWNDSDDDERSQSGSSISSISSSGSSKMRSFLQLVLPQSSSGQPVSPNRKPRQDIERGTPSTSGSPHSLSGNMSGACDSDDQSQAKAVCWQRRPGQLVIVVFLLFASAAIVTSAVLYAKQKRSKGNTAASGNSPDSIGFNTASPTISPLPTSSPTVTSFPTTSPTLYPSYTPSQTPSMAPSTPAPSESPTLPPEPTFAPSPSPSEAPSLLPSSSPSYTPTSVPSDAPSAMPSSSPSAVPSASPSAAPSAAPSLSPTVSQAPSSMPSQSPTTIFSTTIFEQLGSTLLGDMQREQYGNSIALSADGAVLAVGARHFEQDGKRRAGRVVVYQMENNVWVQRGDTLFGRNDIDQFGFGVALSSDGLRLAVSEPGFDGPAGDRSGNVRVFDWSDGAWVQVGSDVGGEAATDLFGLSVALSGDGTRLAVGAPYHDNDNGALAGRVRVFEYSTESTEWEPLGNALDGSRELDWFGWDIDLSEDGRMVAVGAPRNSEYGGYVRCFEWNDSWIQVGNDIVNDYGSVQLDDRFGLAVSLSADGERVAVGAPWKDADSNLRNSGLAAVYQLADSSEWSMLGNVLEGEGFNHQLGWSLQLSATGEFLTVGIPGHDQQGINSGRVAFHRFDDDNWDTAANHLNGGFERDEFGFSVALSDSGMTLAVGATVSSGPTAGGAGYVQVFESI